jgi:hypothetical protein
MADPLSVAAPVAGLISLGIQVTQGLVVSIRPARTKMKAW